MASATLAEADSAEPSPDRPPAPTVAPAASHGSLCVRRGTHRGRRRGVRRLAPGIGGVALAKAVTSEVQRDAEAAHVARVLPADASPEEIATAAELAQKDARPAVTAGREPVLEEKSE